MREGITHQYGVSLTAFSSDNMEEIPGPVSEPISYPLPKEYTWVYFDLETTELGMSSAIHVSNTYLVQSATLHSEIIIQTPSWLVLALPLILYLLYDTTNRMFYLYHQVTLRHINTCSKIFMRRRFSEIVIFMVINVFHKFPIYNICCVILVLDLNNCFPRS